MRKERRTLLCVMVDPSPYTLESQVSSATHHRDTSVWVPSVCTPHTCEHVGLRNSCEHGDLRDAFLVHKKTKRVREQKRRKKGSQGGNEAVSCRSGAFVCHSIFWPLPSPAAWLGCTYSWWSWCGYRTSQRLYRRRRRDNFREMHSSLCISGDTSGDTLGVLSYWTIRIQT